MFLLPIAISLCYPTYYEFKQVFRDGLGYFLDPQNFLDVSYILICLYNCFAQYTAGPFHVRSKVLMMFIMQMGLAKTF